MEWTSWVGKIKWDVSFETFEHIKDNLSHYLSLISDYMGPVFPSKFVPYKRYLDI